MAVPGSHRRIDAIPGLVMLSGSDDKLGRLSRPGQENAFRHGSSRWSGAKLSTETPCWTAAFI